jgi:hypothetical protein
VRCCWLPIGAIPTTATDLNLNDLGPLSIHE